MADLNQANPQYDNGAANHVRCAVSFANPRLPPDAGTNVQCQFALLRSTFSTHSG